MNEELRSVYNDMCTAMIAKNRDTLERLHGDDFVLVHMTGMRQTKQEYINAIMNGTLNYYSAELDDISASIKDDIAELTAKSRVNAAVFGGGGHTWRLRLDMRLARKNGSWIFTHARASTY